MTEPNCLQSLTCLNKLLQQFDQYAEVQIFMQILSWFIYNHSYLCLDLFIESHVLITRIGLYLVFDLFVESHFFIIIILKNNHSYFTFIFTWGYSGKWKWDSTIFIFPGFIKKIWISRSYFLPVNYH